MNTPTLYPALALVLAAGEAAGYWQRVPEANPTDARVRVRDSAGREWGLRVSQGKVTLGGTWFEADTCTVYTSSDADASASADRDPATIAKTLERRVCSNEAAKAAHDAARASLAQQVEQRAKLREHIAALRPLGYTVARQQPGEVDPLPRGVTHEVTLYAPGKPGLRVSCTGRVYMTHTPGFDIADAAKVLPYFER